MRGNLKVVHKLLKKGADRKILTKDNKDIYTLAKESQWEHLA